MSVEETLEMQGDELTAFEKSELSRYQMIYWTGSVRVKNLH